MWPGAVAPPCQLWPSPQAMAGAGIVQAVFHDQAGVITVRDSRSSHSGATESWRGGESCRCRQWDAPHCT